MPKVTMPQLGESVAEGTIGRWLKQPGDKVAKYEPLLEVITDKVNAEVPSPFEGVLTEILVQEGETVPNNAEIAVIESADGAEATAAAAAPTASAAAPTAAAAAAAAPTASSAAPSPSPQPTAAEVLPSATPVPAETSAAPQPSAEASAAQRSAEASAAQRSAEASAAQPSPQPAPAGEPASVSGAPTQARAAVTSPPVAVSPDAGAGVGDADARMTPAVRRLLREHGLQPAQIVGSGHGGRITREDVLDFVESARTGRSVGHQSAAGAAAGPAAGPAPQQPPAGPPTSPSPAAPPAAAPSGAAAAASASAAPGQVAPARATAGSGTRVEFPAGVDELLVPMTQMRKGIAAQMTRALSVPHAYVSLEVDATNLVRVREAAKRDYQSREGISLSYVPFVVKASVEALRRSPTLNAHWTDDGLLAKRRINVGVAVAVEDGLLVPVIRDVDSLSINGINHAIADVAARARAGKLRIDDFGGGTFTVDNTGWLGSNMTMPIINIPEVAILTMEEMKKRPVVIETPQGDVIAIRPVMNMVLGIDHRANDGAGGAAFLRDVRAWLEAVGPETAIY